MINCKTICPHEKMRNAKRIHFSCLTCRERRIRYGKVDMNNYYKAVVSLSVTADDENGDYIPAECTFYTLLIDQNRKFKRIKNALLKKVLTFAEFLSN